jgi:DNA recombination protein RmuC
MDYGLLVILLVIVAGFGGLFWLLNKRLSPPSSVDSDELVNTVIAVAKEKLEGDKQQMAADMTAKKEAIESLVKDLRKDIEVRQAEIRGLEKDRNLKFGEITKSIEEHKKLTADLAGSAESLKSLLSNSQLRGNWGERQLEQIFHNAGFLEGQHYLIQHQLSSGVRPDFMVRLPNERLVSIDAKFPFANLQKMTEAEDKTEKARLAKEFAKDVKDKINEVAGKGYISPEDGTMDFAIMFVPSEVVFDHVNKTYADLVDEAMSKKVIMASPYNLLAIVRTVLEAHRHFVFESSMAEVLKKLELFLNDYRLFQDEFGRLSKNFEAVQKGFTQIQTTRYKQMDLHLNQIKAAHSGSKQLEQTLGAELPELSEADELESEQ